MCGTFDGKVELQRIYIHPGFHEGGPGKLLANKLDIAKDQGFKNMRLGVWKENIKAQKVMRS